MDIHAAVLTTMAVVLLVQSNFGTCQINLFNQTVKFKSISCWLDKVTPRSVPPLEKHFNKTDSYKLRGDAIQKCAKIAKSLWLSIFAIQDGGWCAGSNIYTSYKYAAATGCQNGKGANAKNDVYEIIYNTTEKVEKENIGCRTTPSNLTSLESYMESTQFAIRKDAIQKCARVAMSLEYGIFALSDGGKCLGRKQVTDEYKALPKSNDCLNGGKGGNGAAHIYKIIYPPKENYTDLGCWTDASNRAVPYWLEKYFVDDNYKERKNAIQNCARVAKHLRMTIFAVQDGGWCAGDITEQNYKKYNSSNKCMDGKGGGLANNVYKLIYPVVTTSLPSVRTTTPTKTSSTNVTGGNTTSCLVAQLPISSYTCAQLNQSVVACTCKATRNTTTIPPTTITLANTTTIIITTTATTTTAAATTTATTAAATTTATTAAATTTATQPVKNATSKTIPVITAKICSPSCHISATCLTGGADPKCKCNASYSGDGVKSCIGFCTSKTIDSRTYPKTSVGLVAYSKEICSTGRSQGSTLCKMNGIDFVFDRPSVLSCDTGIDDVLKDIQNTTTEQSMAAVVVEKFSSDLQVLTSTKINITETTNVVNAINTLSLQPVITTTSIQSIVGTASNIVSSHSQTNNTASTLLTSLDRFADRVEFEEDVHTYTVKSEQIILQLHKLTHSGLNSTEEIKLESSFETTTENETSVIPGNVVSVNSKTVLEILRNSNCTGGPRLQSYHHRDGSLFRNQSSLGETSQISSFGISCNGTRKNLTLAAPFSVAYKNESSKNQKEPLTGNEKKTKLTKFECQEIDPVTKKWTTVGSATVREGLAPECKHKKAGSSFALLFTSIEVPSAKALGIVSKIGCALSVIGLLLTMIIYGCTKKLRKRKPTPIMMNICACLIVSYLLFVFGVDKVSNNTMCWAISVALHFTLLCGWMWMFINSVLMYMSLVKVFRSNSIRRQTVCILAYGLPMFIVATTACMAGLYIDKHKDMSDLFFESSYRRRNTCWIRHYSLYLSFLVPVGTLLVGNIVLFGAILSSVLKKKEIQSTAKQIDLWNQLMIAISMIAMMGLTWVFGYFMLVSTNGHYIELMSWIFTILNTTQGIVIFFMMCVRQETVRKMWLTPLILKLSCGTYAKVETRRDSDKATRTTKV